MAYEKIGWKDYPSTSTPINAKNMNHMDEGIFENDKQISEIKKSMDEIAEIVYPVGSIYMSVNGINPANLFGGEWERWGKGKTVIGVDTEDSNFDEPETEGGKKEISLSKENIPEHTHKVISAKDALYTDFAKETVNIQESERTITHTASHGHLVQYKEPSYTAVRVGNYTDYNNSIAVAQAITSRYVSDTTSNVNGFDVAIPEHTHEATTEGHKHSIKASEIASVLNTEAEGESKPYSNLPPYITCYMWKRTK